MPHFRNRSGQDLVLMDGTHPTGVLVEADATVEVVDDTAVAGLEGQSIWEPVQAPASPSKTAATPATKE